MEHESRLPVTERTCPLPFIVAPCLVGALVWLCAMIAGMSH
ncbi:MAG TPA: hypothetical protein VKE98_17130 [Gemmataceae bacterium]|nr:hypothetical protein [Gemmataceae bacterium]